MSKKFEVRDKIRRKKEYQTGPWGHGAKTVTISKICAGGYELEIVEDNGLCILWKTNYFELESENLPDWVKVEPEKIIPAKKSFSGIILEPNTDRPPLRVSNSDVGDQRLRLGNLTINYGYFTKKGVQEWIKALQELESHME